MQQKEYCAMRRVKGIFEDLINIFKTAVSVVK